MKIQLRVLFSTLLISQFLFSISPAVAEAEPCGDINLIETIDGIDYLCTPGEDGNYFLPTNLQIPLATFSPAELTQNGYSFRISNYSPQFEYSVDGTSGDTFISEGGLVTLTGDYRVDEALALTTTMGQYFRVQDVPIQEGLFHRLPLPSFGKPEFIGDRVNIRILNFSQSYDWSIESTFGDAVIDNSGVITVFRTLGRQDFALTIVADYLDFTQLKVIYRIGQALEVISPEPEPIPVIPTVDTPTFTDIETQTAHTFAFHVTNLNIDVQLTATSNLGTVTIGLDGLVSTVGLNRNESATVTISASRFGYETSTVQFTGSSLFEYQKITSLQLKQLILKPTTQIERGYLIYGKVSQVPKGQGGFLVTISNEGNKKSKIFKDNYSWLVGTPEVFTNIVAGDFFTAVVEVKGFKVYKISKGLVKTLPILEVAQLNRY